MDSCISVVFEILPAYQLKKNTADLSSLDFILKSIPVYRTASGLDEAALKQTARNEAKAIALRDLRQGTYGQDYMMKPPVLFRQIACLEMQPKYTVIQSLNQLFIEAKNRPLKAR